MSKNNKPGIGLLGILQIVFITLKLTNNIDWTWPWVLSPTLLPIAIVVVGGVLYGLTLLTLIGLGVYTYDDVLKKHNKNEQK